MEIVYRAAAVYLFLWFITRIVGKRTLGEMTAFELVLLVIMGDLVQQGVTQEDYSITGAMLAVGTMTLMILTFEWISFRFPRTRKPLEGQPVIVIRDGAMLPRMMRYERLTDDELKEQLRQQGIDDVAKVSLGVLEPDGRLSFFQRSGEDEDQHQQPEKHKG